MRHRPRLILLLTGLCCFALPLRAQQLLGRKISLTLSGRPLKTILAAMAQKGGFYFSYNSNSLPGDSVTGIDLHNQTVRQGLDGLLGEDYEYRETGGYIIIRPRVYNGEAYTISGYVTDKTTGEKIPSASVYEKRQLVAVLTDERGFYRLRLRHRHAHTLLTVSRMGYNDTVLSLPAGSNLRQDIAISPLRFVYLRPVTITPYSKIEGTRLGRFFLSSRQKVQDINLSRFFADKPFQYSLVPGLGTHGELSAQVVNKFSFNILGGYTAGVNGFELGGLFNVDKKDVQYVQVAGLFNTVGGGVRGFQLGGLQNQVLSAVSGVQVAGLDNTVKEAVNGFQLGGLFNTDKKDLQFAQVAGLFNIVGGGARGFQLGGVFNHVSGDFSGFRGAGIGNITLGGSRGLQFAGIFNRSRYQEGVQIAPVNIADSATGYSFGLVTLSRNGYRRLSLSWNETLDINLAFKSGNKHLYNIVLAGANADMQRNKAFSFGYGLGNTFSLGTRLAFITELTGQAVYTGSWKNMPFLTRLQPALEWRLGRDVAVFAGPAFSVFFPDATPPGDGYSKIIPAHSLFITRHARGWWGMQAGISLF
ncbi:STN and carboxypeptidase regulatory-like domain-containing protein [Compostibacter hankyongensis]|uniref:Carboxypeptidase-like regulatory domain-containing protein n=1 Tax=Compostibacter hankyongensis TaxID=1007089 RepID=A0ABP8G4T6_9BACT